MNILNHFRFRSNQYKSITKHGYWLDFRPKSIQYYQISLKCGNTQGSGLGWIKILEYW